jgi:hypothetical protein
MILGPAWICHAVRHWYESTSAVGKSEWAGRHSRTIGAAGFPSNTDGEIPSADN